MPRVPSTRGKSICNCSETRRAQEAQGSDPRRDSGGARQGRGAACCSASSTCCTTSAPDSPMHSFGPLTEPSPTASALRPSHVTDSLTVPWALVHRRSRVVVAPPNNVLFLENLPTECTEMMLSMLFQSAAHADALSPCSTRHMRCDSLERHRQRS